MSCLDCDDTGYVAQTGAFKTKQHSYEYVDSVKRCPRYLLYFQELVEMLGVQTASVKIKLQRIGEVRPAHGCGAAVLRHEEIREGLSRAEVKK